MNKATMKKKFPVGRRGYVQSLNLDKNWGTVAGYAAMNKLIITWDNPMQGTTNVDPEDFISEIIDAPALPDLTKKRDRKVDRRAKQIAEGQKITDDNAEAKEAQRRQILEDNKALGIKELPPAVKALNKTQQAQWCLLHDYPTSATAKLIGEPYSYVHRIRKSLIEFGMIHP